MLRKQFVGEFHSTTSPRLNILAMVLSRLGWAVEHSFRLVAFMVDDEVEPAAKAQFEA
jgi:hypothetical protein